MTSPPFPWWHVWRDLVTLQWLRGADDQISFSKILSMIVLVWCVWKIVPDSSWAFVAVLLLLLGFVQGPKVFTAVAQRITFGFTRAESTTETDVGKRTTTAVEQSAPLVPSVAAAPAPAPAPPGD